MFKKEARAVGFDDFPFKKFSRGNDIVIGVVMRGPLFEGVLSTSVRIDGLNSTKKIIDLVNSSKFKEQLKVIFFDGICFAGFNTVDIETVSKKTGIPTITIMRKKPNFKKIRKALKRVRRSELREKL